jgi:transglutaminase-like putative cysteine protease
VTTPGFVLRQRVRYSYDAAVTNLHQELRVVPPPRHRGQHRRMWGVSVEGVDTWTLASRVDSFGNFVIDVDVPRVDRLVDFVVEVETGIGRRPSNAVPSDPRYLAVTPLTTPDPAIEQMAGAAGSGMEELCEEVHRALTYEWGVTGVTTTAAEALAGARGVCQDFAHVMLAACRHAGVPARYVSGHLPGEGGSHAWVEVLRPTRSGQWWAEGWDPTHNRRTTDRYLVIATGRDYGDAAPFSGSYRGSGTPGRLEVTKTLDLRRADHRGALAG